MAAVRGGRGKKKEPLLPSSTTFPTGSKQGRCGGSTISASVGSIRVRSRTAMASHSGASDGCWQNLSLCFDSSCTIATCVALAWSKSLLGSNIWKEWDTHTWIGGKRERVMRTQQIFLCSSETEYVQSWGKNTTSFPYEMIVERWFTTSNGAACSRSCSREDMSRQSSGCKDSRFF